MQLKIQSEPSITKSEACFEGFLEGCWSYSWVPLRENSHWLKQELGRFLTYARNAREAKNQWNLGFWIGQSMAIRYQLGYIRFNGYWSRDSYLMLFRLEEVPTINRPMDRDELVSIKTKGH